MAIDINTVQSDVGNRIKELRAERNMSREDLALLLGADIPTLSKVERGIKPPTVYLLNRICVAFDISLYELCDEKEYKRLFTDVCKKLEFQISRIPTEDGVNRVIKAVEELVKKEIDDHKKSGSNTKSEK